MKNHLHTYLLSERCKEYGLNPADAFGIEADWARWCFTSAVFYLSRQVNNWLNETEEYQDGKITKTRPKWTLEQALAGKPGQPIHGISALLFLSGQDVM